MSTPIESQSQRRAAPSCRFCGAELGHVVVDLGMSPLCESYLSADGLDEMEPFYPLLVYVCGRCFLVQLREYVRADEIFTDYAYFSSYSDSWLEHARRFTEDVVSRFSLNQDSSVIELASNDGYLLRNFVARGIPALGIEPARNVAAVAIANGVPTLVRFFGRALAAELAREQRLADLIIGNNVLAQVPDLNDFVGGLKILLAPDGVATLEFPHLVRLVEENQFDTIYHEHFSYFSLVTVERVVEAAALTVFDVEELPTHGGSLRVYIRHQEDHSRPVSDRVLRLADYERAVGVESVEWYDSFAERVRETKRKLLEFLIGAKRAGRSIVGYGAPGKGNTLLNYCGIRTDFLDYTVDRSPHKQGKFLPGTHIPIYEPERINATRPDYVLILPWNLKHEIMNAWSHIREWGGRFVVPIPEVRVHK